MFSSNSFNRIRKKNFSPITCSFVGIFLAHFYLSFACNLPLSFVPCASFGIVHPSWIDLQAKCTFFPRIYHFSISIELHLHSSSSALTAFLNIPHGMKVVSRRAQERASKKVASHTVPTRNHFSIYFSNKNAIDSRMKKLEK